MTEGESEADRLRTGYEKGRRMRERAHRPRVGFPFVFLVLFVAEADWVKRNGG